MLAWVSLIAMDSPELRRTQGVLQNKLLKLDSDDKVNHMAWTGHIPDLHFSINAGSLQYQREWVESYCSPPRPDDI
jgi:hypothetical protein